jgi:uncharacterized protein (TIGR02186 family)
MRRVRALILSCALGCLAAPLALAQGELPTETIQIGLSTDTIAITSNFSGADLTIFGALSNTDPQVQRQGHYDIIVVLEGPEVPLVVRQKSRVFGMWLNTRSADFDLVPLSYIASSTRKMRDITDGDSFKKLSLGIEHLLIDTGRTKNILAADFVNALKQLNVKAGTYSEDSGRVEFISPNLFRATLKLPTNVPVGKHKARAFLFRNGAFIKESSTSLQIEKAGFEQNIYNIAHQYSLYYGLFAVALAMFTGWLGRVIFKKD